tara:strand:+ start:2361 stop:2660 length:300 start_codon:yes stop_codon:yes gene_type:complete
MIIYVDIDETICVTPANRDYTRSRPIEENINKINTLYNEGHTIIYWTARGCESGKNYHDLTNEQLNDWGAKRHELKMGKPMYDLFICDKAINSNQFFEN